MNWFQLANLNSIFDKAGETEVLNSLRKIKDITIQTQRGARSMILEVRRGYEGDDEICSLFDKASFYSPDSPKKVKMLIDVVIDLMASRIIKKNIEEEKNRLKNRDMGSFNVIKGLVS